MVGSVFPRSRCSASTKLISLRNRPHKHPDIVYRTDNLIFCIKPPKWAKKRISVFHGGGSREQLVETSFKLRYGWVEENEKLGEYFMPPNLNQAEYKLDPPKRNFITVMFRFSDIKLLEGWWW